MQRTAIQLLLTRACLLLVACGGGGGGGGVAGGDTSAAAVSFPPSAAALTDPNVTQILVARGPNGNVNIPYVSVTVCTPGSSNCKTINNVLLDTGSTGLRLFASQVNAAPALTLPAQTIGGSSAISECANFLNNKAWGSIQLADVVMAGERAASVPVQLMDAADAGRVKCTGAALIDTSTRSIQVAPPDGTQSLSANGILGVGLFTNDRQNYFNCASPGAGCVAISAPATQQVQNPVSLFGVNNNGVVVQLPALDASGATSASGYLIFGVGTQNNNRLGSANVVPVNGLGFFTTVYRGVSMSRSFMDSGSNGLFFTDPSPQVLAGACSPAYSDFFCPSGTQNLSASIQLSGAVATVGFSIANADTLFATGNKYAFNNLGGAMAGSSFDWGLPFFFGRTVYTVIEGASPNAATGSLAKPFYAFTN
jgi:hypothetical protein